MGYKGTYLLKKKDFPWGNEFSYPLPHTHAINDIECFSGSHGL